jgi:hypothetical protein
MANPSKQDEAISWSMKSDRKTFSQMYCDFSNTDLRENCDYKMSFIDIVLEFGFSNFKEPIEAQYKNLKLQVFSIQTKAYTLLCMMMQHGIWLS